jgi:hypothetical protein
MLLNQLKIKLLPMRFWVKRCGLAQCETLQARVTDEATLKELHKAVKTAAHYLPWENNCLPQALTMQQLLKRKGLAHTLYFGCLKEDSELLAHTWVRCGDLIVIGNRPAQNYQSVACYAKLPSS